MGIIPDELKRQTFPCPACGQIISSEDSICRFCSKEIDDELRGISIGIELRKRSLARLRNHKIYIGAGLCIFSIGIGTLLLPLLEAKLGANMVNFSCWTPIMIAGGLVAAIMGFRGYLAEKKYLRNV
jgi:RNA polymerase subunit RPABC4/transcription elongation factor Spt4